MELTLINPDDPDAPPATVAVNTVNESLGANQSVPTWRIQIGKYSTTKQTLDDLAGGSITDLVGWEGVLSDTDGSVLVSGIVDDVTLKAQKYKLEIIQSPSPSPQW